jgi:hypothetical protein
MSVDATPPPRGGDVYEFAWRSVTHLEARIATLDTKANVLIGLVVGAVAATGALGKSALENADWTCVWTIGSACLLAVEGAVAGAIVLYCLRTVNPGARHRDGIESPLTAPETYVVWPPGPGRKTTGIRGATREVWRTLRPHQSSSRMMGKEAHAAVLRGLSGEQLLENLVYMQTTLVHLVERKLDAYRAAVLLTRAFVWYQGLLVLVLFLTLARG